MAATVRHLWPAEAADNAQARSWSYESGTLLDGIAAQWHATADGDN